MAYVPGYAHDVFVSYAHGDDRQWIALLIDRLESELKKKLGIKPVIWIDDEKLRPSRDFSGEIPESVRSSAVFVLLTSPSYIRSSYCVAQECRAFESTIKAKRARFDAAEFGRELFAFRCPIVRTDNDEHWSLFPGLTDIVFCDESDTFAANTPAFDTSFRKLVGELAGLLKRMRNHSTSVFLYPPYPRADVAPVHEALFAELSAQSYRILPDRNVNLKEQLREASISVFLLGPQYDETAGELVDIAGTVQKPWVAWCSPAVEQTGDPEQMGFCDHVERLDSAGKTYLRPGIMPAKLKEEVLAILRPSARALTETDGKPRVYLVYNARDTAEKKNAGNISYHFRKEIHFEHPNDPGLHTALLTGSDAVLLVWGTADEDWCSREFQGIQTCRRNGVQGLCLFDPAEAKTAVLEAIRKQFHDLYIGEQFGGFDPSRLESFFVPLLRRASGGNP